MVLDYIARAERELVVDDVSSITSRDLKSGSLTYEQSKVRFEMLEYIFECCANALNFNIESNLVRLAL